MISKGNHVKFASFVLLWPVKKQKHDFQVCLADRVLDIEKIVEDKDSQNTKRSTKVANELFSDNMKEKNLTEPEEKKQLAQTWKHFMSKRERKNSFNV